MDGSKFGLKLLCQIKRTLSPAFEKQELVLDFGKHRGKILSEVDDGYLQWMERRMPSESWRRMASRVLKERSQAGSTDVQILLADLKTCSKTGNLERGKQVHQKAVECGQDSDIYLLNTLINMYGKCGSMGDARQVFDTMKYTTVVSWTSLILGYAENGKGLEALDLFTRMKSEGPPPNSVTVVAALKACCSLALKGVECINRVKDIQSFARNSGLDLNTYVQNTLIVTYAKCGNMVDARSVFDMMNHPDVVSWSALILGYADNGQGFSALDLFTRMKNGGPAYDAATFVAALRACISLALKEGSHGREECRDRGKDIHDLAEENGYSSNVFLQNTLIDMYAKCGSMWAARSVFNSIKYPDVVSWTVLIQGYADNGQGLTALDLFTTMRSAGPPPDSVAFAAVIKACGLVGGLEFGRKVHSEVNEIDVVLVTCLIDFYAKCGSLAEAQRVFDSVETRVSITWNALLTGFSSCGEPEYVFRLFERMQDAGFRPDSVTFLCLLTCCSHAGLLEKGKESFDAMSTKFEIMPTIEHYTCMVDIFGRAKKLDEAMALLQRMPCTPNEVTWTTILDDCCKWKNVEIGRLAFQSLVNLKAKDTAAYVLMGQIYGSTGMVQEQEMIMTMSKTMRNTEDLYCAVESI